MTELLSDTRTPIRTCVGCGRRQAKSELVRIVENPQSSLQVDLKQSLPGRGVWLHPNQRCYQKARSSGRLSRSLRCDCRGDQAWAQLEDFFAVQD